MTDAEARGSLSAERYLRERVDDQLRWYGLRSAAAKRWYLGLQFATIVLAASVPVLALASGDLRVRIAVAVIGALTTVAAGLGSLYGFRERWVDYRSAAEALKHEKYLFLTGAAPYVDTGAFSVFVNRVESIIREERVAWRERSLDTDDSDEATSTANDMTTSTQTPDRSDPLEVLAESTPESTSSPVSDPIPAIRRSTSPGRTEVEV